MNLLIKNVRIENAPQLTDIRIKDGKFAYKQIFAGKDKYEFSARMKALHSEFAEVI